jgi:phosphatase NudJ
MSWKPAITVAAVIERDQRFLIVEEQIGGRRVLNQPAGHVEVNESPLAAVIRETREETAWQFLPQSLIGVYLWRKPNSDCDTLRIAFTGELGSHDPSQALDNPIVATHWLTRTELLERSAQLRTPMVLRCIDDYLAGQRAPLATLADLRHTP